MTPAPTGSARGAQAPRGRPQLQLVMLGVLARAARLLGRGGDGLRLIRAVVAAPRPAGLWSPRSPRLA